MSVKKIILVKILFILFISADCYAEKGEVVYNSYDCDYFIVATESGFALLEWYGGNDPDEGDIIVGEFETYGMKNIFNITADMELQVWVEDYWLSKSSVVEKYNYFCN